MTSGVGLLPIGAFNQTNDLSNHTRGTTWILGNQFNYITGRNGPPGASFLSQSFLDSGGDSDAVRQTGRSGLSAGDGWPSFSVWANGAYTSFSDDHPAIEVDSDTASAYFGGDVTLFEKLILGVSLGFDDTDSESDLPLAGGGSSMAEDDTDTLTVSPYAVFLINDMFDVDASFGYSNSDTDSSRFNGAATVTSSSDTDSWFFAVNGNATVWFDYLGVTGSVGYRRSVAQTDGFTESDGTVVPSSESVLGTFVGRVRANYYYPTGNESFLQAVMPFLSVALEYDHTRDRPDVGPTQAGPNDDRFGVVVSGGVNVVLTDAVSAGVEAAGVVGRSNQSSITGTGNVRVSF